MGPDTRLVWHTKPRTARMGPRSVEAPALGQGYHSPVSPHALAWDWGLITHSSGKHLRLTFWK